MMETDASIHSLIAQTGWFRTYQLSPVKDSGNNRVFRLDADGKSFLLKRYFQHPGDARDRFAAERAFYSFLWDAGVRRTPKPLEWLPEERLALFEFVFGEKPTAVTPALLQQAIDFFCELNEQRQSSGAATLPSASEAYFTLGEHLRRVDFRVTRLGAINPGSEIDRQALDFVLNELTPAWRTTNSITIQNHSAEYLAGTLPMGERCISPSDFGFHNSICAGDGKLRFFDFEYAGWDDPAKMVCDFFCQPAMPVNRAELADFIAKLTGKTPFSGLTNRVAILLPVYRIKWCCIILNEFLPVDRARRTFSNPEDDIAARKKGQLEKAFRALRESS
jgi:hypothetical protein